MHHVISTTCIFTVVPAKVESRNTDQANLALSVFQASGLRLRRPRNDSAEKADFTNTISGQALRMTGVNRGRAKKTVILRSGRSPRLEGRTSGRHKRRER
jgi:hypothetical protein